MAVANAVAVLAFCAAAVDAQIFLGRSAGPAEVPADAEAPPSAGDLRARLRDLEAEAASLRRQLATAGPGPEAPTEAAHLFDGAPRQRFREVWTKEELEVAGFVHRGNRSSDRSSHDELSTLLGAAPLPGSFFWGDVNGTSFLTMNRNQHIPQYCGACWAIAAASALSDRIKIKRGAKGIDINLSVQSVLSCGSATAAASTRLGLPSPGSCWGGGGGSFYQWGYQLSKATNGSFGLPYETSNPYLACSEMPTWAQTATTKTGNGFEQTGICPSVNTQCDYMNWAKTCSTFPAMGGTCAGLGQFPNATIDDFGWIQGPEAMMKEIHNRGPIACGINALPLVNYTGGIAGDDDWEGEQSIDHLISVAGWGTDTDGTKYWHVRNSWGEYWGEMGWARVKFNTLLIEQECYWATPGTFTSPEDMNKPCFEDGSNCAPQGKLAEIV